MINYLEKAVPEAEIEKSNISAEIFNPKKPGAELVLSQVEPIMNKAFIGLRNDYIDLARARIFSPQNVAVLLKDRGESIIGFTVASSVPSQPEIAEISMTAILPEYQGKGHVAKLMEILEEELKKRGFKYFLRQAATQNGYADKIKKHYKDRIISSQEKTDKDFGSQIEFKIQLDEERSS